MRAKLPHTPYALRGAHGAHRERNYMRATLKRKTRRYTSPSPGEQYRRRALLFSMSGAWPLTRLQRPNAKGYEGCLKEPPIPPDGMTELEIERIQRLLARRNWILVVAADGRLKPVRMI